MARVYVDVSHQLTQDEALRRVKHSIGDLKKKFSVRISNVHEEWLGSTCRMSGSIEDVPMYGRISVELTVKVTGRNVAVSSDNLPALAALYTGTIEAKIRQHLQEILDRESDA